MAKSYISGAPYKLAGNRLVFSSWYYVESERGLDWCDENGNPAKIMSTFDPMDPRIKWKGRLPNYGIRIKLNTAQRSGPLFKNDKPWDKRGMVATILKDGGVYRAWCATAWHYDKHRGNNFLCYMESDDGYEWRKPDCGIYEYAGNKNNNILLDRVCSSIRQLLRRNAINGLMKKILLRKKQLNTLKSIPVMLTGKL